MGRIEILTGVERRRDWSHEEKLSILDETAVAGAKIADVARRLNTHRFGHLNLKQKNLRLNNRHGFRLQF
ncbi:transposase [Rhizobium sp. P44RR-XXIV]|uniref:transposase n=1 Tax=Rhizobium sp. P44RR-XXIV TaxID=1921145 RepID=UPI00098699FC|nr:transposase [Rhizobium sp. P44RR-XXIV]TIX89168.1 hypothetical protein BSK43_021415 [Rhizobium sp. P44RR-XXIV]